MKRALIATVVCVLAGTATASPTPMVTPPAGWRADPERGSALATKLTAVPHFGGATASVAVEAYAPAAGTIALVVTRVSADKLPGTRDQAVRAELGVLTGAVDAEAKQVRATRTQRDAGVKVDAVTLIAADGDHIVAVTGECLDGSTDAALATACTEALRTLDTGIPLAQRIALGIGADEPPPPVREDRGRDDTHAQFRDGTKVVMPPMSVPADRAPIDRRPIYIGGGLVVMAVVLYLNRRRRDRFDADDGDAKDDDHDR